MLERWFPCHNHEQYTNIFALHPKPQLGYQSLCYWAPQAISFGPLFQYKWEVKIKPTEGLASFLGQAYMLHWCDSTTRLWFPSFLDNQPLVCYGFFNLYIGTKFFRERVGGWDDRYWSGVQWRRFSCEYHVHMSWGVKNK